MRDTTMQQAPGVVLGEDWVAPDPDAGVMRPRRRGFLLQGSPLARKIITFNLLALVVLVAGVLYLNPFRESLVVQRERALVAEAELVADVFEAILPSGAPVSLVAGDGIDPATVLAALNLPAGADAYVFDISGNLVAVSRGADRPVRPLPEGLRQDDRSTALTGFLARLWAGLTRITGSTPADRPQDDGEARVRPLIADAAGGQTSLATAQDGGGGTIFSVATPVMGAAGPVAVVAMSSAAGEIDALVRAEREQVLQMFVTAVLVSIGLSLVLASTIANPLADLAAAAERGRDRNARKMAPARVRIPDLTARPDEIGRLSGAMRGMVAALYDRIEANEQFAADVAHEIKNPLASLRSAVGSLRMVKREDHREKLLDVIEHDVRRLDRLVSDISNASRLDAELVKEEEESFDLIRMITNITDHLGAEAEGRGVDFVTDLPPRPLPIQGLEARLAQVFVNIITNAISFCENGDAVRVWVRKRDNRVLVVVEDTGPGIPEQALHKIFNRFYSERPPGQFGNHSGLGLAISKQIVEAHGGVIWAENIRPTEADVTSEPLGARFVVGLPV